jgi:hypothetical protein
MPPGEYPGDGTKLAAPRGVQETGGIVLCLKGAGWWVAAGKEAPTRKVWTPSRGSMVAAPLNDAASAA